MFERKVLLSVVISMGVAQALTDCDIVLSAYQAMGGSTAGVTNCCGWNGVTCSGVNVTSIGWSSKGLKNSIPAQLGDLVNLQYLDLPNNQLTGAIPAQLGNLKNLQWLGLYNNQLSGAIPTQLENLLSIQQLFLYNNQLTGTIPPQLGNLKNLRVLALRANQLTGGIPVQLANLKTLQQLFLEKNQLSGSIPAELGNLTNLQLLRLDQNQLTGSIPPEFGNLTNLQYLYIYNNQLTGSIPPQFGRMKNLQDLELFINQLSGPIPAELGNLNNLQKLYLYGNQLNGTIPAQLGNLKNLNTLYLHNNQLTGAIPASLSTISGFQYLAFADNPGLSPSSFGAFPRSAFDTNQWNAFKAYYGLMRKRQVTSTDPVWSTDTLLQYCPISSLNLVNKDQILMNCMAGLNKFCVGTTDIAGCQNKWEVIFSNSIYKFIYDQCFPWRGATATGCQSALQTFSSGISDPNIRALQVGFAQMTINSQLTNAAIAPCSSSQKCSRISI